MALYVYDLDNVSLNVFGIDVTGGYGSGGSISIKRNKELFMNTAGRAGDIVRSKITDESATIEITVLQTSEVNSRLSAVQALDRFATNGAGVGVFMCRDRTNGDEYFAEKCWINKLPDVEFNEEQSDRVWQLYCEKLEYNPGGRSSVAISFGV